MADDTAFLLEVRRGLLTLQRAIDNRLKHLKVDEPNEKT